MTKKHFAIILLVASFFVVACNQIGRKDEVLAKVGNAQLLQSELEFAMATMPQARRSSPDARKMMFNNLLDSRVRSLVAKSQFPQASATIAANLEKIHHRDLTQMYQQFFLHENLGHSEDQLLAWFRKNQDAFKLDSNEKRDFQQLKDSVVHRITIEENRDSLLAYFEKNKDSFRQPGDTANPKFEDVKDKVEFAFIQYWKQKIVQESKEKLRAKHKVEFATLPELDYKSFYEKHKERFKTAATYKLLHIEMADSAKLAQISTNIQNEEDFKNLVATQSENAETKANQGALSLVKHNHCLPNGLGMIPELFNLVAQSEVGLIPQVVKAPDTQKFHVFWLKETIAPQIKAVERAKNDVIVQMKAQGMEKYDSNTVLATVATKHKIYEKDYLELLDEVPPQQKRMYSRDRLLDLMIDWEVFAIEAKAQKLDQSMHYKALKILRESDMWALVFRDSIERKAMGIDEQVLKDLHKANPNNVFRDQEFALVLNEVALMASTPEFFFKKEFAINKEKYPEATSWESVKGNIFNNIRAEQMSNVSKRLLMKYRQKIGVDILDTNLMEKSDIMDPTKLYKDARASYDARKLSEAKTLLYDLRNYHSENDDIMMQATMLLAQIYNEEEQFENAVKEFTTHAALWPQSDEAYKSLFMEGFILAENLKQDSAALVVFKTMLEKYPKTDLTEDADWMVRNIESGGKLVPALLDSIAAQDSLEAAKISAPQTPEQ
ncbi:MAG: outer membrane protein assembly factor BamD [Fibrobacter sp.]|nr:outer membrane protein assembly factor BamD [Fibrobacter sp.]